MNHKLLNSEIQNFITINVDKEVSQLALQKNPFPDVNWIEIVHQISAKAKAKNKLPTWFKTKGIFYPTKISVEQTSSEEAANYKSSLVNGENLIDLTGGFGIDTYFFSKRINSVIHCEIDSELSEIAKHNFEKLDIKNISCINGDSYTILQNLNKKFSWIYIDPSRRNEAKGKVFMFKDCTPNVTELLDFYLDYSDNILIKTAPILDITAGLAELKNVKTIHIVAIENEVKELLWIVSKDYSGEISIKTVNIAKKETSKFEFILGENKGIPSFSLPEKFLFEPNSPIMKSGGFDEVSVFFNLKKLHNHSHLYTSNTIIDFPGRIFRIENCFIYNKANMKQHLEHQKMNITVRNFPESVETIRKKWKIKEGGDKYCFFTTDTNNHKIVLICTKIK